MMPRLVPSRPTPGRLGWLPALASVLLLVGPPPTPAKAQVDQGSADPRLRGIFAPKGFRARVAAAEPALVEPVAMAFDDAGQVYVAEWRPSDRSFETWDALALPEGGSARVRRRRKETTDVIKRLRDLDNDGTFETAEVVAEGLEMPVAILPHKNALLVACVGRLERWSDEDGDGRFETRAVLADGFAAADGRRGLTGLTLGLDGWLYLTTGDGGDTRAVGPDGSRVDLARAGGVFRCRVDGSKLQPFAIGLRNPSRGPAIDAGGRPILVDEGGDDGSKFQGGRLIQPVEGGDYGWRLRPGPVPGPDFDRGAAAGERPGKLPPVAGIGPGAAAGVVVYQGSALPEACRDLVIAPDPSRGTVRGFQVERKGDALALKAEVSLLASADDHFAPRQVAVGADGALYVLDGRSRAVDDGRPSGDGKSGRLYRITWEGDGVIPALPLKPNGWKRIFDAETDQLIARFLTSADLAEAGRAQRELVDRGAAGRSAFLTWAGNSTMPPPFRLLMIQAARQFWNDEVEAALANLLADPVADVRRLAAQALAWEPKAANPRLVPRLLERLDDPDGRVVREAALALARHAEGRAQQVAAVLLRWLHAHPKADPTVRDGLLRALERMGDAGVEEVALAVRTRRGEERVTAVGLFTGLRSAQAADQLAGLVKIPDLSTGERVALIRMFPDIPPEIPAPTTGLADFVAKHPEADPAVKVAALETCRLAGNPASALVLALLDDDDESVRLAATRLAAQSRPPGSMAKLAARLADAARTPAERLAIVRAVRGAGPSAFPALDAAYLASEAPGFRRAALRSLAEVGRAKAVPALQAALAGPDPSLRAEAIRILGESPSTAVVLGRAYLDRTLARPDLPAVLAALRPHEGAEVRQLVARIEDDAARGRTALDPSDLRARALKGDPWSGLGVFFRESEGRCSACHRVEGRGGSAGPPLAAGRAGLTLDKAIEAVLHHPKIGPGSRPTARQASRDGRGPGPKDVLVSAIADAPTRADDRASSRPERAALDLTPDEIADLAAFLLGKPAQDALKHGPRRVDRVLAIGPFAPGIDKLRAPLDRVDPARPLAGQDGASATWGPIESSSRGTFNLRGQFGSKPGRAYLAFQVRSPRDQSAALRFAIEGAARVYLNGAKLADVTARDPARLAPAFARPRPDALAPLPDLSALPLKAGLNLVIVALDRPEADDALAAFEVVAPEPVELAIPKN